MEAGAELIDYVVQRRKNSVTHIVFPQVVPDVFDGVEFGAVGRKGREVKVGKRQGRYM